MIAYDFSGESPRIRASYYNLLSPSGKAHLAFLLLQERNILNNFVLSYGTPQLRRLESKAKKNTLSEDEIELLRVSPKTFKGLLTSGDMVTNKEAVEVINYYLDCLDILEEDLKLLESFTSNAGQQNSEIVLGKQISYWNLHPNQFSISVYQTLFDSPEYTKQEVYKLIKMKLGSEFTQQPAKVFTDIKEVDALLLNLRGTELEKKSLSRKLLDLRTVGDLSSYDYKNSVTRLVKLLIDKDEEFDILLYPSLKEVLPQYHNQKTKYFIHMLSQYNQVQSVLVSSRIDLTNLHAFYRKADELCSS